MGGGRTLIPGLDNSVLVSVAAVAVILVVGSTYLPAFLSPGYLVLQLRIASFLGVVAAGAMVVIVLGHIDLSIPWVMTTAAMVATTLVGLGAPWSALAIPGGLAVGLVVGLLNGIGVGYLRLPSMILTLAMNAVLLGLAVLYTGGFAPQTKASALMRVLGKDSSILGIPNMLWVWLLVSARDPAGVAWQSVRARDLRDRQSGARGLPVRHSHQPYGDALFRLVGADERVGRRAARRPA